MFFLHLTSNGIPVFWQCGGKPQPCVSPPPSLHPSLPSSPFMIKACCCCGDRRWGVKRLKQRAVSVSCRSVGLQSLMIYWHRFIEQIWAWFIGKRGHRSGQSLDFASSRLFIIHEQQRETVYVWTSATSKKRWMCMSLWVHACVFLFCTVCVNTFCEVILFVCVYAAVLLTLTPLFLSFFSDMRW